MSTTVDDVRTRILNRELSWLDFNSRVLDLAADDSLPLLERAKFLAIFASNLDEFFQVRVAALKDQVAGKVTRVSADGRTASEQLDAVGLRVAELIARQEAIFAEALVPALGAAGIEISGWDELSIEDQTQLVGVFEERIFPILTPLAVDPGHPFPYISTLSLNLGVVVRDPVTEQRRFARVKVPNSLPRFVQLAGRSCFVPLEQIIAAQLSALFPGMTVETSIAFRVTRNADLTLEEEEADDLLAAVEMELRRRRFGRAVRLEIDSHAPQDILDTLMSELDLEPRDVTMMRTAIDLGGLWAVYAIDRADLKDQPWPAVTQSRLAEATDDGRSVFSVIRQRDVLVQHPYESFRTSTEEFIRQAAEDSRVLAIKMTLYRTSGDSPIVQHLIRAAERGKQVAVLVELKARFDEQANIAWAKALERAGVHVVYGLVGLKTHSKCVLVVRDDPDGIRRYCHLGTGNYNSSTARLYEDFALFTCSADVGADLTQLFNHLTGYSRDAHYRTLFVAPRWFRQHFTELVANEGRHGSSGHIVCKMNSLADPAMIEALYAASRAGVKIELFVRGICCLRPGVPGMSENITVHSLLGRYLEHSRVYWFANGGSSGAPVVLIGSADLMERNLDGRVEVLVPITSPELVDRLKSMIDIVREDDTATWRLGPDGRWRRNVGERRSSAQRRLYELAVLRSRSASET